VLFNMANALPHTVGVAALIGALVVLPIKKVR
jgi:hypothetical protein